MNEVQELCQCVTAPAFTFAGFSAIARVIDVHDGDTITVIMKYQGSHYRFHIRLCSIDAPEITSKDSSIYSKAVQARNRVIQLVCNSTSPIPKEVTTKKHVQSILQKQDPPPLIYVDVIGEDNYGRLLSKVSTFPQRIDISETLLSEKFALPYVGGKKTSWAGLNT